MLRVHRQLVKTKSLGRKENINFLVGCVKVIMPSTIVPSWTKLKESWITPASPLQLPPGYKKLLPSPSLNENSTNTSLWLVKASIIEDKPSESTLDQNHRVEMTVDPFLSLEGPSSDDIVTKENENDTIQILFINTDSDEHGGNLPVPLP